ncbi:hypothetical protein NE237_019180 [Protea cynaroides]|uniref:Uncharacterized protein n=1 Tax=Protea cynaroides TaxID=273540 RepID=A0A9Q0KBA7_9MAGN|nr:hypothetical protein NE237_019180 [Protea cynaroides]
MWNKSVASTARGAFQDHHRHIVLFYSGSHRLHKFNNDKTGTAWMNCAKVVQEAQSMLCGTKVQWPELVGMKGKEAMEVIKKDNPLVTPWLVGKQKFYICSLLQLCYCDR